MTKIRKNLKRERRHKRVRAKIFGTASRPRLSVNRSNKHLFLQLIDDDKGKTLVGVSDIALRKLRRSPQARSESRSRSVSGKKITKSDLAYETGKALAKKAVEAGVKKAVFDRGGYKYHGRVEKIAQGAREGGLVF